jgi:hypothetical protein
MRPIERSSNRNNHLSLSMSDRAAILFCLSAGMVMFVPIIIHIIQCVKDDWAAMLIIGLIVPPVGWVHGVGILFGVWQ